MFGFCAVRGFFKNSQVSVPEKTLSPKNTWPIYRGDSTWRCCGNMSPSVEPNSGDTDGFRACERGHSVEQVTERYTCGTADGTGTAVVAAPARPNDQEVSVRSP